MRVNRMDLLEGCILVADVFSKSANPIIPKKTVLTRLHLDVLKAFNVKSVDVEGILANGKPFNPEPRHIEEERIEQPKVIERAPVEEKEELDLTKEYFNAVGRFKDYFESWQKGESVNYIVIKSLLDPLVNKFINEPRRIIGLYHYNQEVDYLYHHAVSVSLLSALVAKRLNYKKKVIYDIAFTGLLADSGMAKLPPRLLKKPTGLFDPDIKQIKQHPVFGYQMLKTDEKVNEGILLGVLQHHEREDGSGYPLGIKSQQLHPFSKIIAVVDSFHAMISERPYRPKQPLYKVLESLQKDHFGKYDPKVLTALMDEATQFSIGNKVRLTNNEIGEIMFVDKMNPTRPILKMDNQRTLSLLDHPNLYVDEIIIST